MDPIEKFEQERKLRIKEQGENSALKTSAMDFSTQSIRAQYSYNFSWLGRPIIQYPQDMIAIQEVIWNVKPDLIIETGIAHGGSLIFNASILELIGGDGLVLGIDIDIRAHNRSAIEAHPMFKRIRMIEGSSVDSNIVNTVKEFVKGKQRVLVILDSNHTHEHVLQEMELYSPFVTLGSYLMVFDTIVEDLPADSMFGRPWSKGNNPKTAVWEFMKKNNAFEIDQEIENKLLVTVAPSGYLKRVR